MVGNVLVLGADERLRRALQFMVPSAHYRAARGAVDTEGIDVDVVVIAGPHPFEELTEVRVHPRLFDKPVVLLAPGHRLSDEDWQALDVWPITTQGFDVLDGLAQQVARLLSRASHPSRRRKWRQEVQTAS